MTKVSVEIKENAIEFGTDLNEDSEKSLIGKLYLNEALQEAIKRGAPVEGAKIVDFKFEMTKLIIVIDTDKDGEKLFELKMDLPEMFDEATGMIKKD